MTVSNITFASKIAKLLDVSDKKGENGQIDKKAWNLFVADKGGKTIKNYITLYNAERSISIYLARQAKKQGRKIEDIGEEWLSNLSGNTPKRQPCHTVQNFWQKNRCIAPSRQVDISYSLMNKYDAELRASNDSRLERLSGGKGWNVASESFITDIPFAKKHTGKILSFISNLIQETLSITSALGTGGFGNNKSPHKITQSYCTHHNAENPKLDIRTNGHSEKLQQKLGSTGFFNWIYNEKDHLDVQIKPEVYTALENGYSLEKIQSAIENNTLSYLAA